VADASDIDVRRLRLQPGDAVLVRLPLRTIEDPAPATRAVREALALAGHADVPVLLCSDQVDVSILGRAELEARG
jgi:hypothetical protein